MNYGGIIVVAAPHVRLSVLPIDSPPTFEVLCVYVTSGRLTEILVVVYRPGSQQIQQRFFDDLSAVLERIGTYSTPVYLVGDFNIRLDRPDDLHAVHFRSLLDACGLTISATGPTHARGGTLDVVACTTATAAVNVVDCGISDHHALQWRSVDKSPMTSSTPSTSSSPATSSADQSSLTEVPVLTRSWRRLDAAAFRAAVSESRLCQPESWPADIDDLCGLYEEELTNILDRLIPLHQVVKRQRPTDPWFDQDCRNSKRQTRRLERLYLAACRRCRPTTSSPSMTSSPSTLGRAVAAAAAAKAAWYSQRRVYRQLRRSKCDEFWRKCVEDNRSNPRLLWRAVDRILGRGKMPASDAIDVNQFRSYFDDKVGRIRTATSGATPPEYSTAPAEVQLPEFRAVSTDDVMRFIGRLPDKSSAADVIPTNILKDIADLVAPFISELFT
jgi:hypothetical protein